MVSGIEAELIDLLSVFIIAAGVGIAVAKVGRFPYTIALLLAGLAASVLGIEIGIELSKELILLVLLPPLLFEGAATTDLERFRADFPPIATLAIVGLVVSILFVGFVGRELFGFPLLIALLLATMVLPTDPVSVLALFEEVGAPDRLAVLVEGESLINDGVAVVIYSALLGLIAESQSEGVGLGGLVTPGRVGEVAAGIVVASLGGAVVGLIVGYAVYRIMVNLDEHMTEIVLTIIVAYGSFLVAEHYFGVSGVIATVVAGLFVGNRGAEYAMSPQTKLSIFNTWETAAFLVNTLVFLLIGTTTPVGQLIDHLGLIAAVIVLVLVARAMVVYPLTRLTNQFVTRPVSLAQQHVVVWGGLHASIPIALVLGVPAGTPFREELRAAVFGVAAFSLIVQGLTMETLLNRLGITTRSEAEELFEVLVGRAKAVDAALEAAERLHDEGDLPTTVYEDFRAEYGREKEDLNEAIASLLDAHPELRRQQTLVGERRILNREKTAIDEAIRSGAITDETGERLRDEVDLKLERVLTGESTVREEREAYEEFWRTQAAEYGLDVAELGDGAPASDDA